MKISPELNMTGTLIFIFRIYWQSTLGYAMSRLLAAELTDKYCFKQLKYIKYICFTNEKLIQ